MAQSKKELALLSVTEAHDRIMEDAAAKVSTEVRFIQSIEVGKIVRQGDIYIHAVQASHPKGAKAQSRQLAIGTTNGSRHMAESPSEVFEGTTAPEWCQRGTFLGPVVTAKERFTVSHPEHAHVSLPPGTYQICHQLDAATLQRVRD